MILAEQHDIVLKQITGVEPAFPAWEASVLPMNHICMNQFCISLL